MSFAKSKLSVLINKEDIWYKLDLRALVIIFDCNIAALFDFSHLNEIYESNNYYINYYYYISYNYYIKYA